ncbi:MAG: 30S ribosomal protein S18 [Elusimicrobia bacterium]|nr:30S ribosomal protein S18 [Elusimicrobiota bacterium]
MEQKEYYRKDSFNKKEVYRKDRCRICREKQKIDYKDVEFLKQFITEGGKLISRLRTGNCAKHQRLISRAVKRARNLAFVPFTK